MMHLMQLLRRFYLLLSYKRYYILFIVLLIVLYNSDEQTQIVGIGSGPVYTAIPKSHSRFVKLGLHGNKTSVNKKAFQEFPWSCVLDTTTGLTWEVKSNDKIQHNKDTLYIWNQISKKQELKITPCTNNNCTTLDLIQTMNQKKLCNKTDWRLPSRIELSSIVNYVQKKPQSATWDNWFPNTNKQFYWSSTTDIGNQTSIWGIGFTFGFDYSYSENVTAHARLVSGSPYLDQETCNNDSVKFTQSQRFSILNNGVVYDNQTNLMWFQCQVGQYWNGSACSGLSLKLTWQEANRTIDRRYHSMPWRIPSITQLATLVNLKCKTPAINTHLFPHTTPHEYWSNTEFASDGNRQWIINFYRGENGILEHSKNAYVQLVKAI